MIPPFLPHGDTNGPWMIRDCVAKLHRKYEEFPHSREFDGYAAARWMDMPWRNRIEMVDLLATWLMQSQIERRPGAIEGVMECRAGIEAALAGVPDDLALEQDIPERTWWCLEALFRAFWVKGVALATMTKVLCMKRPALIPMLDSHVMGFLFRCEWPLRDGSRISDLAAAGVVAMGQFRQLMLHGENLKALAAIRDELAPWLTGLEVSSGAAPAPSLVRVLDSLLWYDWKGHDYFGTKVLEKDLGPAALIDRLKDADHAVRWRAAKALGEIVPAAREAVAALAEVKRDESEDSLVGRQSSIDRYSGVQLSGSRIARQSSMDG
jgi:hypothetical protein